jgi:ribonuclease VapC
MSCSPNASGNSSERCAVSRIVLDSSAVIALVNREPGGDVVRANLAEAMICTVNVAEIVGRLMRKGESVEAVRRLLATFDFDIADFDSELAVKTGALIVDTSKVGLSLGDRACLAVAARYGLPVMTADRSWASLNIGVAVQLIR